VDVIELERSVRLTGTACDRELHMDPERLNPNGRRIALGIQPVAAARVSSWDWCTSCAHEGAYGIATLCVSGGQGMAVLVERV